MADTFSSKRKMMVSVVLALLIMVLSPVSAFASEIATDSEITEHVTDYTFDEAISSKNTDISSEEVITKDEETTIEEDFIIEESSYVDYSDRLDSVLFLLQYITGIMMFFLVVVLCKYVYSFFNIFF